MDNIRVIELVRADLCPYIQRLSSNTNYLYPKILHTLSTEVAGQLDRLISASEREILETRDYERLKQLSELEHLAKKARNKPVFF